MSTRRSGSAAVMQPRLIAKFTRPRSVLFTCAAAPGEPRLWGASMHFCIGTSNSARTFASPAPG